MDPIVSLQLDEDVRQDVALTLVRRVTEAVAGAQQRDAFLIDWDDQLKGRTPILGTRRWRGASELNGTLTREAHLELLSLLTQAQRKDPKWTVEPEADGADEDARLQEEWLTAKAAQYQLNKSLYSVAYNALRDPVALLYTGWRQSVRSSQDEQYRDTQDPEGELIDAQARDPQKQYESVPVLREEVEHEGIEFRVPDLADFYLYPADAQSIADAQGCGERMLLTEDQLLDGIQDYGYDEHAVHQLLASSPTHIRDSAAQDYRLRKNAADGISGDNAEAADGFYECFLWFGRLPKLRDRGDAGPSGLRRGNGGYRIPEEYLQSEILALLCPERSIVLKLDFSPYPERPYIPFSILPEPNRFLGAGVCQLLEQLQEEETATIRYTLDAMNLEMAPVLTAPREWIREFGKWSIYPGAVLPMDTPGEIAPLQWTRNSPLGLELTQTIRGMAKSVIAAKGYGELDSKQRKNGEMQNVLTATDSKFDLFLSNFQDAMAELAARIVALEMRAMGEGEQQFRAGNETKSISAQQLRGRFRYVPTATSTTSTPEMRLQLDQAKQGAQMAYFQALTQVPPQFAPFLWHSTREVLLDMGVRQPEDWIGPQPQAPPMMPGAGMPLPPEVLAMVQQGVPPQVAMQLVAGGGPGMQQSIALAQAGKGALLGPGPASA